MAVLYGSEVYGYEKADINETLFLQFCKSNFTHLKEYLYGDLLSTWFQMLTEYKIYTSL